MTGPADEDWDAFDELIAKDDDPPRTEHDKSNETRRPATTSSSAARKTSTDDWLGLRPNTNAADVTPSYEPSSRGPNVSRRQQNFRRQGTQPRASRSAGLLFSDDDDDDDDDGGGGGGGRGDDGKNDMIKKTAGRNVFDLFEDAALRGGGRPATTAAGGGGGGDPADSTTSLSKRRETSPSVAATAVRSGTVATEKLPAWLSGLIQQPKDDPAPPDHSPPPPVPPQADTEETVVRVQKPGTNETKTADETPSSVLSLLRGKDGLQSSILELIHELAKKKQDIQHATITLIRDQQNNDLLIKALLMDNNSPAATNSDGQELERLRSENNKLQLQIEHISKKHELEIDALKTKYELQQNVLHEKLDRHEKRVGELEEERKADMAERKESEKRLKETYEDRLRTIHESHLIDLKQSAELQKIKMNHLEDVESSLRDSKPRRLTSDEMTAREMSISAQDKKLRDLQEEVDKQMAVLEGERSALQMKVEEFQSRNQRERNGLELDGKELKRSVKAFEDRRKAWEREKKSEIQYIESRKQELEAVRSSVVDEQRKLAEERFEVASERYRLESILKLDAGTGPDLIQAKVEVKENFKELEKREKELEKRLENVTEMEKRLTEEKRQLQEQDDEIKIKSIRVEKMFKAAISKQEEGLIALESAKDIQNKFDKKGKDIHNRLLDIIRREENVVQEETKLAKEREAFNKQRKKLDLILPQLSTDEMRFLNPKLNKYEAEKEVYYKKTQLY